MMIKNTAAAAAACLGLLAGPAAAKDLRAVTEDGRKVLLSPDGKWRFDSSAPVVQAPADSDASPYRPVVKRFSVAFNTADWSLRPKQDSDGPNKRSFQHKTLPLQAMVISDEMPASNAAIKSVILGNAKNAGATTTVLLDETVRVSDKEVGSFRMAAALKDMEFVFWSYYFANEDGNIQVTCFTAQSLFYKYAEECRKFLAGFKID
ncbi:MAG: hypothetical protein U1F53_09055 [Burkholderiaceae bacterium]